MNCFEVNGSKILEGLRISGDGTRPYVELKKEWSPSTSSLIKLFLDKQLSDKFAAASCNGLFKQDYTRLMACDFEQTSEYWLTDAAPNPEKKALVLVSIEASMQRVYNGMGKAKISVNGDGAEILVEQETVTSNPGTFSKLGSFSAAHTALVLMVPNSTLTLESGAYKPSNFRSASALARKNISVKKLVLRSDGKLEWTK